MKRVVLAVLLTATLAWPLSARQWTSRDGAHSVEADLVKVENGNAVLQRKDGVRVTVPLAKLSKADVRYIEGAAKTAEEGTADKVGGSATKPAKPAADDAVPSGGPTDRGTPPTGRRESGSARTHKTGNAEDEDVRWVEGSSRAPPHQRVTYGPPGCPVWVCDDVVWDIAKGTSQASLERSYNNDSNKDLTALSPDGRWFAGTVNSGSPSPHIPVWDTQSGKIRFTVPGGSFKPADAPQLLHFTNEKFYIVATEKIEVRKLPSGELERTVQTPWANFFSHPAYFSADGKYFALDASEGWKGRSGVVIIDMENGKAVAGLNSPRERPSKARPLGERRPTKVVASKYGAGSGNAIAFSPDNQEVVSISSCYDKWRQVTCWNSRGLPILDEIIATNQPMTSTNVQWFPNGKAWLVDEVVIDREYCLPVAYVQRQERFTSAHPHVWDDNHLVGFFSGRTYSPSVAEIPWKDIQASLAELSEGGAAFLGPTTPVSVRMELSTLASKPVAQATLDELRDGITQGLTRSGLRVEKECSTFFRVRATDQVKDAKPILVRQIPFELRGGKISRFTNERGILTAVVKEGSTSFQQSPVAWLVLELMVPDSPTPIWRDSRAINLADVGLSLSSLGSELKELEFPCFIPKSDELLALPVLLDCDPQVARKKKKTGRRLSSLHTTLRREDAAATLVFPSPSPFRPSPFALY